MTPHFTFSLLLIVGLFGCGEQPQNSTPLSFSSPHEDSLQFRASFNNFLNNDLDIHVIEPDGTHLFIAQDESDSGAEISQDCNCNGCSTQPHESIIWPTNRAGTGLYEIWVEVSGACSSEVVESEFTLSVLEGDMLKASLNGKLSEGQSQVLYYQFSP